jgi:hypothetical protein
MIIPIILAFALMLPILSFKGLLDYSEGLRKYHISLALWLRANAPENSSLAGWDMGAIPYFSRLPKVIDLIEIGLLNSKTTHEGYSVATILAEKPSFIMLPVKPAHQRRLNFTGNDGFNTNYEHLVTFTPNGSNGFEVFARKDVILPEKPVAELRKYAASLMEKAE